MDLIFVNDYDPQFDLYEPEFAALLALALQRLQFMKKGSLEVNLVDQATIHELNRTYRQIDRPTDVISFAFLDPVEGEVAIQGDEVEMILGEIFISVDQAQKQADEYQHSLKRELSFLFVHGLLHLLGYDHQTPDEEKEMFTLQEAILQERGTKYE